MLNRFSASISGASARAALRADKELLAPPAAPAGVVADYDAYRLIDGVYDIPPGMMQIGKTGVVPCIR